MSLKKVKKGSNMYQWVDATHAHLAGRCPHECVYCYVQAMAKRFPSMQERYSGPLVLMEKEFDVEYGEGKTIFLGHLNDLFAEDVPSEFISRIIGHSEEWPKNKYVLQTKNPARMAQYTLGPNYILGCTIETNRDMSDISSAPKAMDRAKAMWELYAAEFETFITVEPVLNFDAEEFAELIIFAKPSFVNIGADSKGGNLKEPSSSELRKFISILQKEKIEIRKKSNLQRILGDN